MNKEFFDYLVKHQSVWAEQYRLNKKAEHQVKRIEFMQKLKRNKLQFFILCNIISFEKL